MKSAQRKHVYESIRFRMGDWFDQRTHSVEPPEPRERRFQIVNGVVQGEHGVSHLSHQWRIEPILERYLEYGINNTARLGINSEDCQHYTSRQSFAVLTHNRYRDSTSQILTPLTLDHLTPIKDPLYDPYTWEEKKDELIWRGAMRCSSRVVNWHLQDEEQQFQRAFVTYSGLGYSTHNMIDRILQSRPRHPREIDKRLELFFNRHFVRYRFVARWHQRFNLRLSGWDWVCLNLASIPRIERYLSTNFEKRFFGKPMVSRLPVESFLPMQQQLTHKYLLNLDGNDVSSGLPYFLQSNSVVLSPVSRWENIFSYGLKPWVHYVPVREDATDLEAKLNYCRRNDKQCREIASNASAYMAQFTMESERMIERAIHQHLRDRLSIQLSPKSIPFRTL